MCAPLTHSSILFLFFQFISKVTVAAPSFAKGNCKNSCGDVSIPYPFGIGSECSLNEWYDISCNETSSPPTVFLTNLNMEVLNISLGSGESDDRPSVRVKSPIISQNCSDREPSRPINFNGRPFYYSHYDNIFVVAGCNNRALLVGPDIVGCTSKCSSNNKLFGPGSTCNDDTCCGITITSGLQSLNATFDKSGQAKESKPERSCKFAFIVERQWFRKNISQVQSMDYVQAILLWGIPNMKLLKLPLNRTKAFYCSENYSGTLINCYCEDGYEGNPYLPNGCQDIDECKDDTHKYNLCGKGQTCVNRAGGYVCERRNIWIIIGPSLGFGLLFSFIGGRKLNKILKKRRVIKLKKKFFKRNGGLLLQQQLFSSEGGIQKAKIFDFEELDRATDYFNESRILGEGGQGTIYKGMLVDGQIVAVKKSKGVDNKVEEFINEVVILSQINHRNVVKLLGCCLETEVPLLVYEFISNGTLCQYLHDQRREFHLTWEMRLRIAIESAEAISYLHSLASIPIYHRDIKSTNILLDEKYRAKVSDFGISRSLSIDQTHLTTDVQGTFGYLDPEYFQSSQFTEKSDVYSFGVVLIELITGEKPISLMDVGKERRSLATHFKLLMQENKLFDIVDARIIQKCIHEEIMAVAKLAYRSLSLSGKKRPTMKEVADELKRIPSLQKGLNAQQTNKEVEYVATHHASYN